MSTGATVYIVVGNVEKGGVVGLIGERERERQLRGRRDGKGSEQRMETSHKHDEVESGLRISSHSILASKARVVSSLLICMSNHALHSFPFPFPPYPFLGGENELW